jgi:hypothetical protein
MGSEVASNAAFGNSGTGYAAISAILQDQVTGKTHGRNPSRAREVKAVQITSIALPPHRAVGAFSSRDATDVICSAWGRWGVDTYQNRGADCLTPNGRRRPSLSCAVFLP